MATKVSEKITQEVVDSVGFSYLGLCDTRREDLPFSDTSILRAYQARGKSKMFEFPMRRNTTQEVKS